MDKLRNISGTIADVIDYYVEHISRDIPEFGNTLTSNALVEDYAEQYLDAWLATQKRMGIHISHSRREEATSLVS